MISVACCPACTSTRLVSLRRDHHWNEDGFRYALATCEACGYSFTDPFPDAAALSKLYSTAFDYGWYKAHRAGIYADAKRRLLETRPWLGRSVLDFGGGHGYLAQAARSLGHDSAVYDPYCNPDPAPLARHWDTIFCLHVLEHSTDPHGLLQSLHALLPQGGTLVLAVPNAAGLGYQRLRTNWLWFQGPLIHVSHFTPTALCQLVDRSGFQLEGLSFHDRWNANCAADLDFRVKTRRMEDEWSETKDPRIAWRNIRYRFKMLETVPERHQDNEALAEILLIARKG